SMVTVEPSTVTLRACESCGTDNASATRAGTTETRVSVASDPAITRSYSNVPSAFAMILAVWMASGPWIAGSLTCTAFSAPMDSALRIDSGARAHGQGHADRLGRPLRAAGGDRHRAVVRLLEA